jgi:hypothetical protein
VSFAPAAICAGALTEAVEAPTVTFCAAMMVSPWPRM